ncbi:MAG TPA: 4Fe-4S dicluster domain-containing protein [Chloroflexi bacterium]|mgnify:CR=1 FL=1|nr:4Fe-4S dicluster domain-containing protein [Chloroflexota bacterium]
MKHPAACIQCGLCVEACPVEKVGGHAIVTFLTNPAADDYSVWLCSSCWRCHEVCPVNVDIYGLMMAQRRREDPPAGYRDAYERLLRTGWALAIDQEMLDQMRADEGLEALELPPADLVEALLDDEA